MKVVTYNFWLLLSPEGTLPRLYTRSPALGANERSMKMSIEVPGEVFKTPSLSANIKLGPVAAQQLDVNVAAAENALKRVVGADVKVTVHNERKDAHDKAMRAIDGK